MEVTLGGDRLGSGKKEKVYGKGYERSTHDLGYVWRSTMASGTLVPFLNEIALPGDSFDIDLNCDIMTHPTIGPLFGSFKVQLDVFIVPMRLYNAKLNMNLHKIGLNMKEIKLPQVKLEADTPNPKKDINGFQINPSSIFAYLGIKGIGHKSDENEEDLSIRREFNAMSWLAYWDIYKQYYANKQEEIGVVIHNNLLINNYGGTLEPTGVFTTFEGNNVALSGDTVPTNAGQWATFPTSYATFVFSEPVAGDFKINPSTIYIQWGNSFVKATELFDNYEITEETWTVKFTGLSVNYQTPFLRTLGSWYIDNEATALLDTEPQLTTFPIENIDTMRERILMAVQDVTSFTIENWAIDPPGFLPPYHLIFTNVEAGAEADEEGRKIYAIQSSQEGLGIKTYQSDLNNNWINTEWLDGDNGVNAITAVQVDEEGKFTMDQLTLQKKLYDLLNRVALSDGSYDAWLEATYDHERFRAATNAVYIGGLSKELVFQEVISNAAAPEADQPLGTLAGRGVLGKKHKGGKISIKVDEPSVIIGNVSLTPRIDYSQGNKWSTSLKTLDDLHKPMLDEIGFQDLITDKLAWFDTGVDSFTGAVTYRSAGKQPAWIDYMSNTNQVYGNFALENNQMFMILNRRYEAEYDGLKTGIRDLTTYIDPSKFNNIFTYTKLDAQNFWVQIGVDMIARRKMSAKVIPNL